MGEFKLGWKRDFEDVRDLDLKAEAVQPFLLSKGDIPDRHLPLPRELPRIKNQLNLGSCTANAGCFMMEACRQRSTRVRAKKLSRLFLYKVTRMLAGDDGDTGAHLRTTMKALAAFGTLPENKYPYNVEAFNEQPGAFEYALAQSYQALTYYRLDRNQDKHKVLDSIKINLSSSRPCIMGFTVFDGCMDGDTGEVSVPDNQGATGGHAVCVTGYDDRRRIGDCMGAFSFPNSYSREWGEEGYGWLPYEYVMQGWSTDWWTVMTQEWLDTKQFGRI